MSMMKMIALPNNYLNLQTTGARILGIDFFTEHESNWYQIYTALIFIFIVYLHTFEELYTAYVYRTDPEPLIVILSYIALHGPGIVFATFIYWHRKTVGKIIQRLHIGRFVPEQNRGGVIEFIMIKNVIRTTRIQFVIVTTIIAIAISNATVAFIKIRLHQPKEKWDTPFVMKFALVDTRFSPVFEMVFIYQWLSITLFPTLISYIDLTITGVIAHLGVQLKILQIALRNINEMSKSLHVEMEKEPLSRSAVLKERLKAGLEECIEHHLEIIRTKDDIEDYFNKPILLTFLANVGQLCFVMYQATMVQLFGFEFVLKICHVLYIIFQFYIYCYWCNEVFSESQHVAQAVYECEWIGKDLKFQKKLILIMVRAQRPLKLTAGKIIDLSMLTFMSIIRASMSYFMVLKRMRK